MVRADLKELRDLDLGGAPYGYTPFCDSRTEMDGFRYLISNFARMLKYENKFLVNWMRAYFKNKKPQNE